MGDKVLEEGADKDYELVLNENGTVKAIKIYYISTYESNPDDTNYVPEGAAMLTTYTINANFIAKMLIVSYQMKRWYSVLFWIIRLSWNIFLWEKIRLSM